MFNPNLTFGFKNITVVKNILTLKEYCVGLYPPDFLFLSFLNYRDNFVVLVAHTYKPLFIVGKPKWMKFPTHFYQDK